MQNLTIWLHLAKIKRFSFYFIPFLCLELITVYDLYVCKIATFYRKSPNLIFKNLIFRSNKAHSVVFWDQTCSNVSVNVFVDSFVIFHVICPNLERWRNFSLSMFINAFINERAFGRPAQGKMIELSKAKSNSLWEAKYLITTAETQEIFLSQETLSKTLIF